MAKFLALVVAIAVLAVPAAQAPASAAPDNFSPKPGVTFNSPVGGLDQRRAIFRKVIRSVNSTKAGEEIKIFTWNFLTRDGVDALLRAQGRKVRVRLLMDARNNTELVNQPFRRLRAELKKNNRGVREGRRSWARLCQGSCRGSTGSAHSKFFMFSKAGRTPRVVMQGSANLTLASTNNQWNDIYTHTRSKAVWQYYSQIFREAAQDRRAPRVFLAKKFESPFRLVQFPLVGKKAVDPVMQLLNQVRCHGAKNTASGRTRIRIAPDVIRHDRGMRLAKKVRSLWNNGCDIRIGYTVVGIDIGKMLRAGGPVPMKHLVQDVNDDGEFDNYFHLKAMSVVGKLVNDPRSYAVLNGSANWSGLSAVSDENIGIYRNQRDTLKYQQHIDFWYNRFARVAAAGGSDTNARQAPSFRGALVPSDGDQLLFGAGPDAVYEDGTPYSTTGVDPYANLLD